MRQTAEWLLAQFPDLHMTIEAMVAEGDTVAVRVLSGGTNLGPLNGMMPPTSLRFAARHPPSPPSSAEGSRLVRARRMESEESHEAMAHQAAGAPTAAVHRRATVVDMPKAAEGSGTVVRRPADLPCGEEFHSNF